MAKTAASDGAGMQRADLKRLLRMASEEPVSAAFGMGSDGKPIILLDKRKQPRALEKGIKDQAPDAKNIRFGTVTASPDDPKLARFMVNKASSGMARKLIVALKGTGFNKVQIVLEDGSSVEDAEGEDEPDLDVTAADTGTDADADADTDTEGDTDAGPRADAGADTGPAAPNAAALGQTLTGLVKQMLTVIAQNPSQKATLAQLATDAQASLKRGDLAQASAGIDVLKQALDIAGGAAAGSGASAAAPDQSSDADDADGQADAASDDADGDTAAPADTQANDGASAAPASGQSSAAPAAASAAPGGDAGSLTAMLTGLVKQLMPIISADPTQRDAVKSIVSQAQASLKSGDLGTVGQHISSLQDILQAGGSQSPAPPDTGSSQPAPPETVSAHPAPPDVGESGAADPAAAQRLHKSRAVWTATRGKIEADLQKLHKAVVDGAKGDEDAADLKNLLSSVIEPVLSNLDETLSETLAKAADAKDEDERQKLLQQAQSTLASYTNYVQGNKILGHLDDNPFVPLSLTKTLTSTLSALSAAVR